MQRDDNKTIHLGWIALRVVADADGNAISAHVVLHAEKDLSPHGALTLAQVAEVAEADLLDRVLAPPGGVPRTATGAASALAEYAGMETATGGPAVHVHPTARTATGND